MLAVNVSANHTFTFVHVTAYISRGGGDGQFPAVYRDKNLIFTTRCQVICSCACGNKTRWFNKTSGHLCCFCDDKTGYFRLKVRSSSAEFVGGKNGCFCDIYSRVCGNKTRYFKPQTWFYRAYRMRTALWINVKLRRNDTKFQHICGLQKHSLSTLIRTSILGFFSSIHAFSEPACAVYSSKRLYPSMQRARKRHGRSLSYHRAMAELCHNIKPQSTTLDYSASSSCDKARPSLIWPHCATAHSHRRAGGRWRSPDERWREEKARYNRVRWSNSITEGKTWLIHCWKTVGSYKQFPFDIQIKV